MKKRQKFNAEDFEPKSFLSWKLLRDILVILFLILLSWKLIGANFVFNFEVFGFTDLLSLIVALFAVALSAAFYFKATEISNHFYDNMYKFTKDVSEILGRIEAGFGERLRHLDEGYTGLRDKFDNLPFDVGSAKQEEEVEKQEVQKKEAELQNMLEDLAVRAKLAESDKKRLFKRLESAREEISSSERELHRLQRKIREAEIFEDIDPEFKSFLLPKLIEHFSPHDFGAPPVVIIGKFENISDTLSVRTISYMRNKKLLTSNKVLSEKGVDLIKNILKIHYKR